MVKRWTAVALAILAIGNGGAMLIDAERWYHTAPGASHTGAFNPHFVWDIGVAFTIAGLGLAARAWRARYWPAALAGAGFLTGHAVIHILGVFGGHAHSPLVEWLLVILPSFLAIWAALPAKGERHA